MLGGADVGMPHEFLDIVELVTGLFEPVGEGGAKGMGGGAFGHAGGRDGGGESLLNTAGGEVVPLDDKGYGGLRRGHGRGKRYCHPQEVAAPGYLRASAGGMETGTSR